MNSNHVENFLIVLMAAAIHFYERMRVRELELRLILHFTEKMTVLYRTMCVLVAFYNMPELAVVLYE